MATGADLAKTDAILVNLAEASLLTIVPANHKKLFSFVRVPQLATSIISHCRKNLAPGPCQS